MKLGSKITAGFIIVSLIALSIAAVGFFQVRQLSEALYQVGVVRLPSLEGLQMMSKATRALEASAFALARPGLDEPALQAELAKQREAWLLAERGYELFEPLPQVPAEQALWAAFVPAWQGLRAAHQASVDDLLQSRGPPFPGAQAQHADLAQPLGLIHRLLDQLLQINFEVADAARSEVIASRADVAALQQIMFVSGVATVFSAIGLGLFVSRSIASPIRQVVAALTRIAKGDLKGKLPVLSDDELGDIASAVNDMAQQLLASEMRIQTLADNLPRGIVYQALRKPDGSLSFNYISAGVQALHGLSAQDVLKQPSLFFEQILPEDRPLIEAATERSVRELSVFNCIARVAPVGQSIRWSHFFSAPRKLANGDIVWDGLEIDVTEQKLLEIALRESETRLTEIFNHTNEIIWVARVDPDHRFVYTSINKVPSVIPLTVDDFNSGTKTAYDAFDPETAARLESNYRRCVSERKLLVIEHQVPSAAGPRYATSTLVPVFDESGQNVVRIIGFIQDTTERVQAVEALRESETRLTEIFEHTNDIIFVARLDPNKGFVYSSINQAVASLGLRREDFDADSKTPFDIFEPENAALIDAQYRRCVAARQSIVVEQKLLLPIGEVHTTATLVPVFDESGQDVVRIVGFVQDTTERARAVEALRASEERYRSIFENAVEGIFQATSDGAIVEVNSSLARLYGYDSRRDAIDGLNQRGASIFVDPGCRAEMLRQLAENGSVQNFECEILRRDGQQSWLSINAHLLRDPFGQTVGIEGSQVDITAHRQAAALEAARVKAEAASEAKSRFLAHMSHEIRTPMNAILGFAQLMMRDPHLTERQRQQLHTIDSNGEHLMALINDILEMAKIEANRSSLDPARFSLIALARDLESMFRIRIEACGLAFQVEIDESGPTHLVGDLGKLRQIFVNLLSNALRFTRSGRISLRFQTEPLDDAGALLVASVEDTGPGIDSSDTATLFDRFEQTSFGRATKGGTGLGLPISREFARMMEGDISVSSAPGQGATFQVQVLLGRVEDDSFPRPDSSSIEPDRPLVLAPGQQEFRMLVVDDEDDTRQFHSEVFHEAGFQVTLARNGAEAIEQFRLVRPRCVVMDLRMPDVGGLEAVKAMRAGEGGQDAKIVILTASAFVEDRHVVLEAGADAFMTKPVRIAELLSQVGRLLGLSYAEAASAATPDSASSLSSLQAIEPAVAERLQLALAAADIDQIVLAIDQLAATAPVAAQQLRRLAEDFNYAALLETLERSQAPQS